jgi:hypothetical protein
MKNAPPLYEIRVHGHLDPRRFRWLENLTVSQNPNDETVIVGPIRDQPSLHGLLGWLYDLGLPLISVKQIYNQNQGKEDDQHYNPQIK